MEWRGKNAVGTDGGIMCQDFKQNMKQKIIDFFYFFLFFKQGHNFGRHGREGRVNTRGTSANVSNLRSSEYLKLLT